MSHILTTVLSPSCTVWHCQLRLCVVVLSMIHLKNFHSPRTISICTISMQLLHLPNELLLIILSNLPVLSVVACKASCRQLRDILKESSVFYRRILNTQDGIQELSIPGSIPDLLSNVWKWEMDWFCFSERGGAMRTISRPCEGPFGVEFENVTDHDFLLRSGYLIHLRRDENPGWSHMDLSLQRDRCEFIPAPECQWTDIYLGPRASMVGSALDLDLDLVAALLRCPRRPKNRLGVHLLQFTTGKCHESANIPVVQLKFEGRYNTYFRNCIEIMGNYLVVLLAHKTRRRSYQTLYLVDWVKGHVICQQRFSANTYFPVLASISKDTFVLGLERDWALALCKITKDGDDLTICRLCILQLPTIQQNTCVQLQAFNRPPSGTNNPPALTRHLTLPFRSAPSESVLSFHVVASNEKKRNTLFFYAHPVDLRALAKRATRAQAAAQASEMRPRSATMLNRLYSMLSHHDPSSRSRLSPIILPWGDWGPRTTRWIPVEDPLYQSLSGNRCAITKRSGEVQVLIFHRELGRVDKIKRKDAVKTNEKVVDVIKGGNLLPVRKMLQGTESTIFGAKDYFLHEIVSELPCFLTEARGAKGQVLMDDQWMVQTQYEDGNHTIRINSVVGKGL